MGKQPDTRQVNGMTAARSVHRLGQRYLKWTAYGIALMIVSLLQTMPRGLPEVFGARPLPILVTAVCIAMFEGPVGGAAAGIAGGVLWDVFGARVFGFHALTLMILCCACGLLSQLLVRNNLISTLLITAAAVILRGLADWFFNGVLAFRPDLIDMLLRQAYSAAYTVVIAPVLYFIVLTISRFLRSRI